MSGSSNSIGRISTERWAGAAYVDFFRDDLTEGQSIVLVDSRTGVAEYAGICTHHLADLVVLLSAPNDLNIEGTKWMASSHRGCRPRWVCAAAVRSRSCQLLPASRQASQVEELAAFRKRFEREFASSVPAAAGSAAGLHPTNRDPLHSLFRVHRRVVARQMSPPHRELYGAYEALTQAVVNVGLDAGILLEPQRQGWLTGLTPERQALISRSDSDRLSGSTAEAGGLPRS